MLQLSCFKMPCFAELRMDRTSFSGHAMTARSSIGRSVGPFPSVSLLEAWTHGFLHLFVTEKERCSFSTYCLEQVSGSYIQHAANQARFRLVDRLVGLEEPSKEA